MQISCFKNIYWWISWNTIIIMFKYLRKIKTFNQDLVRKACKLYSIPPHLQLSLCSVLHSGHYRHHHHHLPQHYLLHRNHKHFGLFLHCHHHFPGHRFRRHRFHHHHHEHHYHHHRVHHHVLTHSHDLHHLHPNLVFF